MITSTKNPLVKRLVDLKEKKHRLAEGVFLIEGEKELLCAVEHGVHLETLVYCDALLGGNRTLTDQKAITQFAQQTKAEPIDVDERVFAKIAYRDSVGGVLAVAELPQSSLDDIKLTADALILVVESAEKPGNLGALLRTADAAGVNAVIVADPAADLYNPNVIRASLGALFTRPTVAASAQQTLDWLIANHFHIIAADPEAAQRYTQADYTHRAAIVLGAEHAGLSPLWRHPAVTPVAIPMHGVMDSLNLAAAGAILIYEALRQRT